MNTRTFADHWTGTGTIENTGDNERLALDSGEYMISEVVNFGTFTLELLQNEYLSGDNVTLKYRHGATENDCINASWQDYIGLFDCLGYVQIRVEVA